MWVTLTHLQTDQNSYGTMDLKNGLFCFLVNFKFIKKGCKYISIWLYFIHILNLLVNLQSTVVGGFTTQGMYPSTGIYNTTVFSYQVSTSAPSKSNNTTIETPTSRKTESGDLNRTLVILIKVLGKGNILLICINIYVYLCRTIEI